MGWCTKANLCKVHLQCIQIIFVLFYLVYKIMAGECDWFVTKESKKKIKDEYPFRKGRVKWKKRKRLTFVLTEIPSLPQAFLHVVQVSLLVASGKAIPAGQGGGRQGKKNWENEINICLKIASQHGKERFEDIILKGCCEWGRENGRLSTLKYERHTLPDSLYGFCWYRQRRPTGVIHRLSHLQGTTASARLRPTRCACLFIDNIWNGNDAREVERIVYSVTLY